VGTREYPWILKKYAGTDTHTVMRTNMKQIFIQQMGIERTIIHALPTH